VSANFVTKIGLTTCAHTHPYYIQWLNNSGKAKVTHSTRVHFFISTYHDYAHCDVVQMQTCSLLLGRPWEFDTDAVHHGKANNYDRVIAKMAKCEYEIQHDQTTPPSSSNAIKLKSCAMLAIQSDLFIPTTVDAHYHALVCSQVLFSLDDITMPFPRAITNLLQEFKDIFPAEIPPGLPHLRGIEHQIDLITGAMLPNRVTYRTNPEETN
jgi:hypothetical protein